MNTRYSCWRISTLSQSSPDKSILVERLIKVVPLLRFQRSTTLEASDLAAPTHCRHALINGKGLLFVEVQGCGHWKKECRVSTQVRDLRHSLEAGEAYARTQLRGERAERGRARGRGCLAQSTGDPRPSITRPSQSACSDLPLGPEIC